MKVVGNWILHSLCVNTYYRYLCSHHEGELVPLFSTNFIPDLLGIGDIIINKIGNSPESVSRFYPLNLIKYIIIISWLIFEPATNYQLLKWQNTNDTLRSSCKQIVTKEQNYKLFSIYKHEKNILYVES